MTKSKRIELYCKIREEKSEELRRKKKTQHGAGFLFVYKNIKIMANLFTQWIYPSKTLTNKKKENKKREETNKVFL